MARLNMNDILTLEPKLTNEGLAQLRQWYAVACSDEDLVKGNDDLTYAEQSYYTGVRQTLQSVIELLTGLPLTDFSEDN